MDGKHQESVMDEERAERNILKEGGEFEESDDGRAPASALGAGMSNQVIRGASSHHD
jgi:hypothetical protein